LFALARDLAGANEIELNLPSPATVGDVRRAVSRARPTLADVVARATFAVNNRYADDPTMVSPADDVACIPPVSGG
jgi:molybdopterin converting factor small subunit